MRVGEIGDDGYVDWRALPSTLTERDIAEIEHEFGIRLPRIVRAFFLARFHLIDQLVLRSHRRQLVMLCETPSDRRLEPLRQSLRSWDPMHEQGLITFAQWGDGWGPLCVDVTRPREDGDCPVVWLDHEALSPEVCASRATLEPLIQPVFESFHAFVEDAFTTP